MEVNDDRNGFLFGNGFLFIAIFGNRYLVMVQRGLTEVYMVWFLVLVVLVFVVAFTFS
jgi:hypothetical protein